MKAFITKYGKYIIGFFLIIAIAYGTYSHFSIAALENKNKELLKVNDVLKADMRAKQAQWEERFNGLEYKAKQLEATLTKLNNQYASLAKNNRDLQAKIDLLVIPIEKEARIAKFKDLGYGGEAIAAKTPTPYEGVLFDWPNADKVLHSVMELEAVKELNTGLKEGITLLEKKVSVQEEVIKNTEAEVRLALSRAEYVEKQNVTKDKIIEDQNKLNEQAIKKAKRSPWFWGGVGLGVGIVIGIVISVFAVI